MNEFKEIQEVEQQQNKYDRLAEPPTSLPLPDGDWIKPTDSFGAVFYINMRLD